MAAGFDLDIHPGSTIEALAQAVGIGRARVVIKTIKSVPGRADNLVCDDWIIRLIQGLDGGQNQTGAQVNAKD